jgi:hypothetical protein
MTTIIPTWHFRPKAPNETERNPVTEEYFDEEAIERPAQALVREVIQNSLDARANGDAVKVRFYVSGPAGALAADRARFWLGDGLPHYVAKGSGLRWSGDLPSCPYLVVEDFGTIGLEGTPDATDLDPGGTNRNHFYAFFRAEGVSENTGGRGKWGVGKT